MTVRIKRIAVNKKLINLLSFIIPALILFSLSITSCKKHEGKDYEADMKIHFGNFDGAFVLYDVKNNFYIKYNSDRCSKRYSPCSTFKIPNTLIGIETGVITDENFSLKWDGKDYGREQWNKDRNLSEAMKYSVVWFYREIAGRIGAERMQHYLDTINYGNKDISGGIDRFWLMSSLEISADEQVKFLTALYNDSLPFSKRATQIVRQIILLDSTNSYKFSGKTGSGYILKDSVKQELGWFIGAVQHPNGSIYIFAANISGKDADGMKAKEICINILKSLKIL